MGILSAVAIAATFGVAIRAEPVRRRRILRAAALLLRVTVCATALNILLARTAVKPPTTDVLVRLFDLKGEEVDDAVLYERWVELWLACALVAPLLARVRRTPSLAAERDPALPWDAVVRMPPASPPLNAATVLLWLVGWGFLATGLVAGHRTADFLRRADHTTGTIADAMGHPRIRFTTAGGAAVAFRQNGGISRALGAAVPVAYLATDPAGTARADTFWANWSGVLDLLWIGGCFILFPFYGLRAAFRAGRW